MAMISPSTTKPKLVQNKIGTFFELKSVSKINVSSAPTIIPLITAGMSVDKNKCLHSDIKKADINVARVPNNISSNVSPIVTEYILERRHPKVNPII